MIVHPKKWINHYNKGMARIEAGLPPQKRCGPRKYEEVSAKEKDYIIKRLRMKNELLRDFLRAAGRKRERQLNIKLYIVGEKSILL